MRSRSVGRTICLFCRGASLKQLISVTEDLDGRDLPVDTPRYRSYASAWHARYASLAMLSFLCADRISQDPRRSVSNGLCRPCNISRREKRSNLRLLSADSCRNFFLRSTFTCSFMICHSRSGQAGSRGESNCVPLAWLWLASASAADVCDVRLPACVNVEAGFETLFGRQSLCDRSQLISSLRRCLCAPRCFHSSLHSSDLRPPRLHSFVQMQPNHKAHGQTRAKRSTSRFPGSLTASVSFVRASGLFLRNSRELASGDSLFDEEPTS